jgi:nascent polypeptide-associated complex subunit alpha
MSSDPKPETQENKEHDSDDQCGHDHDHEHGHDHKHGHDEDGDDKKANRGEKKFRKAMTKLGMKPVSGITRVTIRKGKQVFFFI